MRQVILGLATLAACALAAPAFANSSSAGFLAAGSLISQSGTVNSFAAIATETGSGGAYDNTMTLRSTAHVSTLYDGAKVIGSFSIAVSGCGAVTAHASGPSEADASVSCTSPTVVLRDKSGVILVAFAASQLASSVSFTAPGTVKGSVTNTSALLSGKLTGSHVIGGTTGPNTTVYLSGTVRVTYGQQAIAATGAIGIAAMTIELAKAPIGDSTVSGTITLLPASAD